MAEDFMYYQMTNVEALYPKLDTTYKFDNRANGGKGGSVRCDALDDGAEYSMSFLMTEAEAKELYKSENERYTKYFESGESTLATAVSFKRSRACEVIVINM